MLKIRKENNEMIVSLYQVKKLNTLFAGFAGAQLKEIFQEKGRKVLFDLSGIQFIDSAGFSMLKEVTLTAEKNNSEFILCNITPEVLELIDLLGLRNYFHISTRNLKKEEIAFSVL